MCRNVKHIEILEFGYEDSYEGVNNAKYESCVEKQKHNMARPYQAALKEARVSKKAADDVRALHEHWLAAMQRIRWNRGESDDEYKARVTRAYDEFRERIAAIRTTVAEATQKPAAVASTKSKPAAKAPARPGKPAAPKTARQPDKAPQS